MSLLIQYLVKLSLSLTIIWMFYELVLRRLTFYNSNRWYLLGYTLACFLIPFINISPVLENNEVARSEIVQLIPSVNQYTIALEEASHCPVPIWSTSYDKWDWMAFGLITGAGIFMLRFIFRCFSFFRMRRKAKLISDNGMKLYQVDQTIIPFSFGNSVFINRELHTGPELEEIIRHEFVHVKQKHTIDIIWSEWLCIINWYNPFAWLLKRSMRQNLEFIADNIVLQNGVNKKQYQYLLLKVIGNNQFSIAQKFNFSSLKKRIAMMNKLKTTKLHLVKFLFVLPLLVVILISFRKQPGETFDQHKQITSGPALTDTIPVQTETNEKGFYIDIKDNKGECTVVVRGKNGKEVERLPLTKWNDNKAYYENMYGEIPPPPPPVPPVPPIPPGITKLPANVTSVSIINEKATVQLKNGSKENYDLNILQEKNEFEKKYGKVPNPPNPPNAPNLANSATLVNPPNPPNSPNAISPTKPAIPPIPPTPPADATEIIPAITSVKEMGRSNVKEFEITRNKAVMHLKNGTTEEYDLTNNDQRKKFETKYGRIIPVGANTTAVVAPVTSTHGSNSVNAVLSPVASSSMTGVFAIDDNGYVITGNEDIVITITSKTTPQQLEEYIKQMKEKGIELKFDKTEFRQGVLSHISGSMSYKDSKSVFSETEFKKLKLAMIKDGDRIYFKVNTGDHREVI